VNEACTTARTISDHDAAIGAVATNGVTGRLYQASYENLYRLPGTSIERLGLHLDTNQCHPRYPAENNAEKEVRSERQIIP